MALWEQTGVTWSTFWLLETQQRGTPLFPNVLGKRTSYPQVALRLPVSPASWRPPPLLSVLQRAWICCGSCGASREAVLSSECLTPSLPSISVSSCSPGECRRPFQDPDHSRTQTRYSVLAVIMHGPPGKGSRWAGASRWGRPRSLAPRAPLCSERMAAEQQEELPISHQSAVAGTAASGDREWKRARMGDGGAGLRFCYCLLTLFPEPAQCHSRPPPPLSPPTPPGAQPHSLFPGWTITPPFLCLWKPLGSRNSHFSGGAGVWPHRIRY